MSLRGQLNYLPPPGTELTDVALTADYRFARSVTLRAGVNRQLINDRLTRYTAGINHINKIVSMGLVGSYLSDDDFSVKLTTSFSFGVRPRSKSPILQSGRLGASGIISARVFLDLNQNGRFDEEDEPLEGVRFHRDGRRSDARSNANGIGFMTGLASYTPVSISVDAASLEDPYWISTVPGIEVVPRPGKATTLEFPIVMTGEVDGIVYLLLDDSARAVSNAEVQLLDTLGTIIQTVKSAFDGFYLFTLVPPGSYNVRISPEQIIRLKLQPPEEWGLVIEASGTIASGIDFTLVRLKK
ncbi:MAG: carboxypeptidase regulatory-like domain-containing protein [candidate division Zixibacteria bacterium]|nr:carboxypeptidase regulatory-like domain-containing protein [candidate division Zixibacteria bacterium]